VLLLSFYAGFIHSATPIDTDGPDFVESSEVVGKGQFQIETDVESTPKVHGGAKEISVTNLLRYGVSETLELRVQRTKLNERSRVQPSIRSVITWELPKDWSIGLMPGVGTAALNSGARYSYAILGVVLGKRINERWRVFIENATPQIARARNGGVISSWNVGTALLINDDLQIGARISQGLNHNTPNNSLLLELAARF
jgi:hypothetical protein